MILVGNQRGNAKNLALHLLKDENERVEVNDLRGFCSDNLASALNESYAMSRHRHRVQMYASTGDFRTKEKLFRFLGKAGEKLSTLDFVDI